jgi:hypothetical protein
MWGEENETARSAGQAGGTAVHTAQHLSMAEIAGFRNADGLEAVGHFEGNGRSCRNVWSAV